MLDTIANHLKKKFPNYTIEAKQPEKGDGHILVNADNHHEICQFLKTNSEINLHVLQLITGTDRPEEKKIEISYILANYIDNTELILKACVDRDKAEIESVADLWKSADFQERECYDMLGVKFLGHPDLRRILCSDDWEGYPLRKDYQVAKEYAGLEINPPHKMNIEDREFAQNQKKQK